MLSLTDEENESYGYQAFCHMCVEESKNDDHDVESDDDCSNSDNSSKRKIE